MSHGEMARTLRGSSGRTSGRPRPWNRPSSDAYPSSIPDAHGIRAGAPARGDQPPVTTDSAAGWSGERRPWVMAIRTTWAVFETSSFCRMFHW